MDIISEATKNTFWIFLSKIFNILLNFFTSIILARYLGVKNLGIYSFVFTYVGFFAIISDFGVSTILTREFSKSEDMNVIENFFNNGVFLEIILSLISFILSVLIILFTDYEKDIKLYIIVASFLLFFSIRSCFISLFQAKMEMEYVSKIEILQNFLRLSFILILVLFKTTLLYFILVHIFSQFLFVMLLWRKIKKTIAIKFDFRCNTLKFIIIEALPVFISTGLYMIHLRIDQMMLAKIKGIESVGYYSVAVKIVENFNIIPVIIMTTIYPLMSKFSGISEKQLVKIYQLNIKYLILFILPVALYIVFFAKDIIVLIYGNKFLPAYKALSFLIWSEIFVFIGAVNYNLILSLRKQGLNLIFTFTMALVNIILNFMLIPKYSFIGAAIATFFSYVVGFLMNIILIKEVPIYLFKMRKKLLSIVIALTPISFILYFINNFLLSIPIGLVLYVLFLVLNGTIDAEDLTLFKRAFSLR